MRRISRFRLSAIVWCATVRRTSPRGQRHEPEHPSQRPSHDVHRRWLIRCRFASPSAAPSSSISGEVWITQEGMREDVILGPGERFTVRSGALILASAIRSNARVYVAGPAVAAASVDNDVLALLRYRARSLRVEQFDRVVRATRQLLLSGLAAVSAHVRRRFRYLATPLAAPRGSAIPTALRTGTSPRLPAPAVQARRTNV